jgi:hypothetical protein
MDDHLKRAQQLQQLLSKAVAEALERKRRLGQYAVIARDGKPHRLLPNEPRAIEAAK